jgi:hypothetical protein
MLALQAMEQPKYKPQLYTHRSTLEYPTNFVSRLVFPPPNFFGVKLLSNRIYPWQLPTVD